MTAATVWCLFSFDELDSIHTTKEAAVAALATANREDTTGTSEYWIQEWPIGGAA